MSIQAWAATDVGRKRKVNEDSALIDAERGLFVVADGMGGRAAGEIASQRCLEAIQSQIIEERNLIIALEREGTNEAAENVRDLIERAVLRACREIFELAEDDKTRRGMGTTVVVMIAAGRKGVIGHVGDSRAYVQRGGKVHQLTEDHSLVEEQIKRGILTREQAAKSDVRNVITRAVGVQPNVEVDTLVVDLLPGDMYLLCSDGLHGYTDDVDITTLTAGVELPMLAQRLVRYANDRGGRDNITALVVSIDESSETDDISVEQKVEILRRIPMFQYMTYKELLALLSIAEARHHPANSVIVAEGGPGEEMFVVIRGEVEVRRGDVSFARVKAGGHFGEMSIVDNSPRSASVFALEPSDTVTLGRDALLKLMRKDSLMAVKLLWAFTLVLSERLRNTNEVVVSLRDEVDRLRSSSTTPFGEEK